MGSAGGIFVGLKKDKFDVIRFTNNRFSIKATVKNKDGGFIWHLVIVYGSAYTEFEMDFIAELHDILDTASYPMLVCGDFNLVNTLLLFSMTGLIDGGCLKFLLLIEDIIGLIIKMIPFLLSLIECSPPWTRILTSHYALLLLFPGWGVTTLH